MHLGTIDNLPAMKDPVRISEIVPEALAAILGRNGIKFGCYRPTLTKCTRYCARSGREPVQLWQKPAKRTK
jgi:hypothetical protein